MKKSIIRNTILASLIAITLFILGGCSFLPKTNTTVSVVGDGYRVILPNNYSEKNNQKYPVVYVIPDDGLGADDRAFVDQLGRTMSSGEAMDMIIVAMNFQNMGITFVEDPFDYALSMTREIDEKYKTIDDPSGRMILGRGSAAALAEAFAYYGRSEKVSKKPQLFGSVASYEPVYDEEDFAWYDMYREKFEALGGLSGTGRSGVKTVADSDDKVSGSSKGADKTSSNNSDDNNAEGKKGSEEGKSSSKKEKSIADKNSDKKDKLSSDKKSQKSTSKEKKKDSATTNGSASESKGKSVATAAGSKIVRYIYTEDPDAALAQSTNYEQAASMMLGGFSHSILDSCISGTLELSKRVLSPEANDPVAKYDIVLDEKLMEIASENYKVTAGIQVYDNETGREIEWISLGSLKGEDGVMSKSSESAEEPVYISNEFEGDSATVKLEATVLGLELSVAESSIVHIRIPDVDEHFVDLMGDWYHARCKKKDIEILPDDYENFETVTPCTGKNDSGYVWYVRTFILPEDYPWGDYTLNLGKIAGGEMCYINGKLQFNGSSLTDNDITRPGDETKDRIYHISAYDLVFGGENTIALLVYAGDEGGWYAGHPIIQNTKEYLRE